MLPTQTDHAQLIARNKHLTDEHENLEKPRDYALEVLRGFEDLEYGLWLISANRAKGTPSPRPAIEHLLGRAAVLVESGPPGAAEPNHIHFLAVLTKEEKEQLEAMIVAQPGCSLESTDTEPVTGSNPLNRDALKTSVGNILTYVLRVDAHRSERHKEVPWAVYGYGALEGARELMLFALDIGVPERPPKPAKKPRAKKPKPKPATKGRKKPMPPAKCRMCPTQLPAIRAKDMDCCSKECRWRKSSGIPAVCLPDDVTSGEVADVSWGTHRLSDGKRVPMMVMHYGSIRIAVVTTGKSATAQREALLEILQEIGVPPRVRLPRALQDDRCTAELIRFHGAQSEPPIRTGKLETGFQVLKYALDLPRETPEKVAVALKAYRAHDYSAKMKPAPKSNPVAPLERRAKHLRLAHLPVATRKAG